MRTLLLDLDRFTGGILREAPVARVGRDKVTPLVTKDGEQVYGGRLLVPGVAESAYRDPSPGQVRLKLVGSVPAGLADFQPVRLVGRCTVSSWFERSRARGASDNAGITITAENVEPFGDGFPVMTGLLPVLPVNPDAFLVLEVREAPGDNPGFDVTLALPSTITDYDSGVTVVRVVHNPGDLVGRPVTFAGLEAKLVAPAGEDVSRSSKASLAMFADRLLLAEPVVAGASRRRSEPAADEQKSPAEG